MDVRYDGAENTASSMGDRSKSVPGLNIVSFFSDLHSSLPHGMPQIYCFGINARFFLYGIFLQDEEEEEEDIDNLVSIHRRNVGDSFTNLRGSTVKYHIHR